MAKVGIVTFQRAHNYGAVLQCLALQEAIRGLKHDVLVIDHINDKLKRSYPDGSLRVNGNGIQKIKKLLRHVLMRTRVRKRFNIFSRFINSNYNLSENEQEFFDAIIFGSDQIWNGSITDNDPFYWGEGTNTKKKIGYALSAGNEDNQLPFHLQQIKQFFNIGVRENSLLLHLKNLGVENACTVLDPTLLLDKNGWIKLLDLNPRQNPKDKYLVVYSLRGRDKTLKFAKRIARNRKLKLIEIGASVSVIPHIGRMELKGPKEFVELIKNATYVVTDSFHGTVFSIIFNRPFISINLEDGHDGRVANILKELDLSQNHITTLNNSDIDSIGMYDIKKINDRLKLLRRHSMDFLSSNLESRD